MPAGKGSRKKWLKKREESRKAIASNKGAMREKKRNKFGLIIIVSGGIVFGLIMWLLSTLNF